LELPSSVQLAIATEVALLSLFPLAPPTTGKVLIRQARKLNFSMHPYFDQIRRNMKMEKTGLE
jgi:hypothetical protein